MIKYILFDDEVQKGPGFANIFHKPKEGIETYYYEPSTDWKETITIINDELKAGTDGFILDLRLDRELDTKYKGNTLAQEIRNLATLGEIKDCPIILFSAPDKLETLYDIDNTSHNLFDAKYIKGALDDRKKSKKARGELIALAQGYKEINENKSINKLFKRSEDNIDYRIVQTFEELISKKTASHEFARFIIQDLLGITGLVINESLLASRLGIDLKRSPKNDWIEIKKLLYQSRYQGVFSTAFERWWMQDVFSWWKQEVSSSPMGNLVSKQRVELINDKFNTHCLPLEENGELHWFVCQKTDVALDLNYAIRLSGNEANIIPWEEANYVSLSNALMIEESEIHISEREKVKRLQKQAEKKK